MGKRKSKERDEDYIRRKIKKLEGKLKDVTNETQTVQEDSTEEIPGPSETPPPTSPAPNQENDTGVNILLITNFIV